MKYKSPEVCFKYYLPENSEEMEIHCNSMKMYVLIDEIKNLCHLEIKHGEVEHTATFAERIQDMIYDKLRI